MSMFRIHNWAPLSVFLGAIMLATSASAASSSGPAPQPGHAYTLMELTDMALTTNPQTALAWDEIRSSQAGVELAHAGYWPLINGDYSVTRTRSVNFTGALNSAVTQYEPSISLSYLLWDFGTRSGTLDSAKFSLIAAQLSNSQTLQDVILAAEQDYYQVLGLQALEQADELSVKDAEASLDSARANQKSGLATVGDVYLAEAALAGAQLTLQQTQGTLAVAEGTLAVEVGFSAATHLKLAPWNQNVTAVMPKPTIEKMLQQAHEARPEILASKASEQAAIANLEATKGRGLPNLTLAADAGRIRTVINGASQSADNYSAGLTLSIPLFAGFGNEAANKQAQAAIDTSQATTAQLIQQVELEVWQAYQNLYTAVVTLATADTQLKSAQQALDVEIARYHIGLDPILNLLSAQATLASARAQLVQAKLNWFTAQAALGHAVGGLNAPTNTMESP